MENQIPIAKAPLFALGHDMKDGLHNHEAAIGILHNTEANFAPDLTAAEAAEADYGVAKTAKSDAATALRIADSNARAFLKSTRAVLAQNLGEDWSAAWEATSFPNQSTAVPGTQDERFTLTGAVKTYLTNNPTMEVDTPKITVTAAKAAILFDALEAARTGANDANTTAGQKKVLRDAAVETLKTRMRNLIGELGQKLDDNDPLWEAFGLNEPGASSTPDVPEALVITAGPAGTLHPDWADARLATRYRVWLQIPTVSTEFRAVATVTDSDATLTGLPSGQTVKVRVTSVNVAGESLPSAEVTIVVP